LNVTDAVIDEVKQWQNRPLDAFFSGLSSRQSPRQWQGWLTNPCTLSWAWIWTGTRNYWVCGFPRMRVQSSGYRYSLKFTTV